EESFVIHADLLIPGRGDPMEDVSVVVKDNKIADITTKSSLSDAFKDLPSISVPVLMPGLWDCHIHLMGAKDFQFAGMLMAHPATMGARLARSLHDIIMSGFTSVRDLGGYACEVAIPVNEGIIPGPNIYSAGSAISQTAGHGDVFDVPVGWAWQRAGVSVHANGDNVGMAPLMLADGVDEVRKAVRLNIRRGAKVIKVLASGGVLSRDDNPLDQQFSDEELKIIVEEAARAKRIVAAHVHGKEGIMAALRAGCKTLEHGTFLDEETIKLAKEKDIVYVATRTVVVEGVKHPELMSPESYEKMKLTAKYHEAAVKLAIKHGVKMATGCDLSISEPGKSLSHGNSGGEPGYLVDAGMTPLQAIEAATANGPLTLGPQAPMSGQVKKGYDADLIALDKNPLEDISVLAKVKHITHVWKGGKVFKSP
ncbi:amidohydrolase 1, partial [Rhizodiscina lignyota]